jgi:tetratricopeptide (TPR) repeat protein
MSGVQSLRSALAALALAAIAATLGGCRTTPEPDPRYKPTESVLEVVAVLRRHVPDDTYHFPPAQDFTGRNVYRSSLLRLESMERVHADALRAAHLDGVIAFAKGRSLERLEAYQLAAEEYRLAAQLDKELAVEAERSADLCEALHDTTHIAMDLDDLSKQEGLETDADGMLELFERRTSRLEALERQAEGTHHVYVVEEEIERSDTARAEYFLALRQILPDGDVRAAGELERLVRRHGDSKNGNRHILALASLYEDLAVEYVDAHPPESLSFDPVRFQELIDATSRLYEVVANQDGRPEKLEASRKLEAFLAFALRVDHDRFTR